MEREQAMACVFGKNPWPDTQIGQELAYAMNFYGGLRPAAFLSYERDAYQGVEDPQLRMTFDSRILYRRQGLSLGAEPWGVPLLGADQVLADCQALGVLPLRAKNKLRLLPPLNIPNDLLEQAVTIIKEVCAK